MERIPFPLYVLEIAAHLVWCYAVSIILVSLPFLVIALMAIWGEGKLISLNTVVSEILKSGLLPDNIPRFVHLWLFMTFRSSVWPRFMAYSPVLTFCLSACIGSALITFASITFTPDFLPPLQLAELTFSMSLIGGVIDRIAYRVGGGNGAPFAPWFGRLLVGRRNFDAFVNWDAERMHTSYETYVEDLRRRRGQGE